MLEVHPEKVAVKDEEEDDDAYANVVIDEEHDEHMRPLTFD